MEEQDQDKNPYQLMYQYLEKETQQVLAEYAVAVLLANLLRTKETRTSARDTSRTGLGAGRA